MSFGFCIKTPRGRFLLKAVLGKHPTTASMSDGMRFLHESDAIGYADQLAQRNPGTWEVWCAEDGRLVHAASAQRSDVPRTASP